MKKGLFIIFLLLCISSCDNNYKTGDNFQLVFTDVDNFWKMYDKVKTIEKEDERVKIIKTEYFDIATLGFKKLIKLDKLTPKYYSNYLRDTLFYNSIRRNVIYLKKDTVLVRSNLKKFSELYPKAKFLDIYFVIGLFNHGGVVVNNTMIIENQMYTKSKETIGDFISVNNLMDKQSLLPLLIHEQIHLSQENKNRNTLLGDAIVEGCADFFMYLQTNKRPSTLQKTYNFGLKNEFEVWEKFKSDMKKERNSVKNLWFYNYSIKEVVYPDLGYFIGHQICKSYYENSINKKKAIEFLLTEKDFEKILKLSKYRGGNKIK